MRMAIVLVLVLDGFWWGEAPERDPPPTYFLSAVELSNTSGSMAEPWMWRGKQIGLFSSKVGLISAPIEEEAE
jgi:hypothetical protein